MNETLTITEGERRLSGVCLKCGAETIERMLNSGTRKYPSWGWVEIPHSCIETLRERIEKLEAALTAKEG